MDFSTIKQYVGLYSSKFAYSMREYALFALYRLLCEYNKRVYYEFSTIDGCELATIKCKLSITSANAADGVTCHKLTVNYYDIRDDFIISTLHVGQLRVKDSTITIVTDSGCINISTGEVFGDMEVNAVFLIIVATCFNYPYDAMKILSWRNESFNEWIKKCPYI